MSADNADGPRATPWRRRFKDRVDCALRHAEPSEGAMTFPSVDNADGWLLEEAAPSVVHVRWNNVYGSRGPGDDALRARLLDPVEQFLHLTQYAVTRHRDERGPYVRVTRWRFAVARFRRRPHSTQVLRIRFLRGFGIGIGREIHMELHIIPCSVRFIVI